MQPHEYIVDSEDIRRLMNQRRSKLANNYDMKIHNAIEEPVKVVTNRIVDEILYEFRHRLSAEITNIVTIELSKLLGVVKEEQPELAPINMTPLYDEERSDAAMTDTTLPCWWSSKVDAMRSNSLVEHTYTRIPDDSTQETTNTMTTPIMYSSKNLFN